MEFNNSILFDIVIITKDSPTEIFLVLKYYSISINLKIIKILILLISCQNLTFVPCASCVISLQKLLSFRLTLCV